MTALPFSITPDMLIYAYENGFFPMAEDRDDPYLHWVEPEMRGIIPLGGLVVSKSLAKTVRADVYEVTADGAFRDVMQACAAREKTWINDDIVDLYCALHAREQAHSIEVRQGGVLVGGLYGVSLGAAFFGESMFHSARDASKVALVHLVARLLRGGYQLLDTQFITPHLATLGAIEISRAHYLRLLQAALNLSATFSALSEKIPLTGRQALDILRGTF